MLLPTTFSPPSPRHIVIIGGGIIGSCTAYYLTRHPLFSPASPSSPSSHSINITILEANAIASGASGKAGGLLAKWAYPKELVDLSWRLHGELAREHGGEVRWGYRRVDVGEVCLRGRGKDETGEQGEQGQGVEKKGNGVGGAGGVSLQKRKRRGTTWSEMDEEEDVDFPATLDFFHHGSISSYTSMGSTSDTAQVHPYQFTSSLAELAIQRGVQLVIGKAVEILREGDYVTGVRYIDKASQEEKILHATDVVIAAGPWSSSPGLWPGESDVKIGGLRAHSVVVKPTREVGAWAVFSQISMPLPHLPDHNPRTKDNSSNKNKIKTPKRKQKHVLTTPEMYTRPDGTVYICGSGDTDVPPPEGTAGVEVNEGRVEEILNAVKGVSDVLGRGEVVRRQACYLPVVEGGEGPLLGKVEGEGQGVGGVWLAAGHSCWGIMNGPATGLLMSELILGGKTSSADIRDLEPGRML